MKSFPIRTAFLSFLKSPEPGPKKKTGFLKGGMTMKYLRIAFILLFVPTVSFAQTSAVSFLEGNWTCKFVDIHSQYQVHYTVKGNQVEMSGSTNYTAIYNAELNGDNLIFSGRSTSNPEYGEIVERNKVLSNRAIHTYSNRFRGVENTVNIICNKN